MILYCKDSLGCIDNNNMELINNRCYHVAHNLCCQIQANHNSSTCTFTTEKSVTCTGACTNEIIPNQ